MVQEGVYIYNTIFATSSPKAFPQDSGVCGQELEGLILKDKKAMSGDSLKHRKIVASFFAMPK